jgi:hypothetical protein
MTPWKKLRSCCVSSLLSGNVSLAFFKKADGWLTFSHGGISTEWTRHKEDDKVHLSFVISTDHVERSVAYTFSLQELTHLKNKKQLRIEDFGSE